MWLFIAYDNTEKSILIALYKLRYEQNKNQPCLLSEMQILQDMERYFPDDFSFEDIVSVELSDCKTSEEYHAVTELLERLEEQHDKYEEYEDFKDNRDEEQEKDKDDDVFMPSFI